jgi:hypothetical protein
VLQHLILIPRGGMCNRLRALASARRLKARADCRCTLIWEWGEFEHFFAPLPDVEVVNRSKIGRLERNLRLTLDVLLRRPARYHKYQPTRWDRLLQRDASRSVDLRQPVVELHSGAIFGGHDEPRLYFPDIRDWLPGLSPRLEEQVEEFRRRHLRGAVGFHIRRTDHQLSTRSSPDALFFARAAELIAAGRRIFLATDNTATERQMRARFGDSLVVYPKQTALAERWPRPFHPLAADEDLIDLFLLARCEFIVGCYGSSYTDFAIALNGSPQCEQLMDTAAVAAAAA